MNIASIYCRGDGVLANSLSEPIRGLPALLRDELDCYQDLLIMVSLRPAPAERAGGNTLAPAWLWGRGVEAELF